MSDLQLGPTICKLGGGSGAHSLGATPTYVSSSSDSMETAALLDSGLQLGPIIGKLGGGAEVSEHDINVSIFRSTGDVIFEDVVEFTLDQESLVAACFHHDRPGNIGGNAAALWCSVWKKGTSRGDEKTLTGTNYNASYELPEICVSGTLPPGEYTTSIARPNSTGIPTAMSPVTFHRITVYIVPL